MIRQKALGYRSASAYLKGLARYDLLVQGRHEVTLPMSNLPDVDQDNIDSQLLDVTRRGIGERGQLLTRLIERVKAAGQPLEGEAIPAAITGKKR